MCRCGSTESGGAAWSSAGAETLRRAPRLPGHPRRSTAATPSRATAGGAARGAKPPRRRGLCPGARNREEVAAARDAPIEPAAPPLPVRATPARPRPRPGCARSRSSSGAAVAPLSPRRAQVKRRRSSNEPRREPTACRGFGPVRWYRPITLPAVTAGTHAGGLSAPPLTLTSRHAVPPPQPGASRLATPARHAPRGRTGPARLASDRFESARVGRAAAPSVCLHPAPPRPSPTPSPRKARQNGAAT